MLLDTSTAPRAAVSDVEAVDLLRKLVEIRSPSGDEAGSVAFLVAAMRELGIDAYIDETGNAVGSIGMGRPEVVLLGHIDTVPGDVPVRMTDGKLYGRGTVDAKGPLAAFVSAMARLQVSGPIPGRVTVIGCVEEEAPSSRGAHGVLPRYRPDVCIVGEPSGVETLTLGYKGSLRARIRVKAPSGHSAHDRATAAEQASDLWQDIRCWAKEVNGGRERAWDCVLPALVGLNSGGDGLSEWCDLQLSVRLPEQIDPRAAERHLRDLAGDATLDVLGAVPAFRAPRVSPVVRAFTAALRADGTAPRFVVKTGTSDMNLVGPAWGCPILAYGPGDASLDHTPDEHIAIVDYLRSIAVIERVLRSLAAPR